MNKFLRIVLIFAAIMAGTVASHAEFRWGPTAGVSLSTLKFKQDVLTVKSIAGPTVGVQGELMFSGIGFGIDVAALYQMQGAKCDLGRWPLWADQGYGNESVLLHTLSIPVNLRFKWTRMSGIEDYVAPYVFGGPVVNFTLAHSNASAMNCAVGNIGVQAGMGFEILKRWQIQGSYTWGMTYACKAKRLIDFSAREKYWTVRAVYFF